jgi:hypothetical protein
VQRRGEEVVEQHRTCDGGDQRRGEAADQRHDHCEQQEQQHVADQVELTADRHQQGGEQRREEHGDGIAAQPTAQTETAARDRERDAATDLAVRDDVYVDVA